MSRTPVSEQLSLDGYFLLPEQDGTAGSLNISLRFRNALSRALKQCPDSRVQVAARMTDLLFGDADEGEVTKAQIDAWTAPSRGAWRMPAEYLPAFIRATGAYGLLDDIAGPLGCRVLAGEEVALAELGAIALQKKHLSSRETALKKSMGESATAKLAAKLGGDT